jgi:hypothetical protein
MSSLNTNPLYFVITRPQECPFCTKAMLELKSRGYNPVEIPWTQETEEMCINNPRLQCIPQDFKTYPRIVRVDGKGPSFIGGYADLMKT